MRYFWNLLTEFFVPPMPVNVDNLSRQPPGIAPAFAC